jgi:hypothetical protein
MAVTDFVRVLAGAQEVFPLITDGRLALDGDLALAGRLAEIFGGPSAY